MWIQSFFIGKTWEKAGLCAQVFRRSGDVQDADLEYDPRDFQRLVESFIYGEGMRMLCMVRDTCVGEGSGRMAFTTNWGIRRGEVKKDDHGRKI